MGWIPSGEIATATSGTYTVTANAGAGGTRVVRIPVDGASDLWVSYRNKAGHDAGLSSTYAFRTSVHSYSGSASAKTFLLTTLGDGESYSDTTNGVTVTQLSNDGLTATISVSVVATPGQPTLAVSPSAGVAQPGASETYTVSLTNRDSAASAPTTFSLSAMGQATDWTYAISPASLTLAPGASGTAQLTVTSLATDADTSQTVTVNVSGAVALHAISSTTTHHVDGTAPSSPALSGSAGRKGASLSWTASTDAHANLGLTYVVYRDGAEIGTTTQTSYSDNAGSGTFTYTVACRDSAGNASADSNALTLTTSTKGGGGGKGNGGGPGGGKGKKK
jgi:VCBS repeat-containing protein